MLTPTSSISGERVAIFTGEKLHQIIAKQEAFKKKDFEQALKDGFLAIDRAILSGEFACGAEHASLACTVLTTASHQIQSTRKKCQDVRLQLAL